MSTLSKSSILVYIFFVSITLHFPHSFSGKLIPLPCFHIVLLFVFGNNLFKVYDCSIRLLSSQFWFSDKIEYFSLCNHFVLCAQRFSWWFWQTHPHTHTHTQTNNQTNKKKITINFVDLCEKLLLLKNERSK